MADLLLTWKVSMGKMKLKEDEKQLLDSLESGEWESVPRLRSEIKKHGH